MTNSAATTPRLSDQAVIPLRTLDPNAPMGDLAWLDQAIGDARVVAIGENAHYNGESYRLRHRLLRYLVERHGFGAYAMESGFPEGWRTDAWVRGRSGADQLGDIMANGLTSLMGLWTHLRAHLEWMRQHNLTAEHPVGFYGIDLPGSNFSMLPGLDLVTTYLAEADPEFEVDPGVREIAASFAAPSAFSAYAAMGAYAELDPSKKAALTSGLAGLLARLEANHEIYVARTSVDAYERAVRAIALTIGLDSMAGAMIQRDSGATRFREAAHIDNVEWILGREDRIVVAAHNGHVQRWPTTLPGQQPSNPMGMRLADQLGKDYVVIGVTTSTGQTLNVSPAEFMAGKLFAELGAPTPDSLDGVMAASHDGPFAVDLRSLSADDVATLRAVTEGRIGSIYSPVNPLEAYDILVHIPHVTAAEVDRDALAHAPSEVQEPFSHWLSEAQG